MVCLYFSEVIENDYGDSDFCERSSLEQTEGVNDIVTNERLNDAQKKLNSLFQKYSDIFSDVPNVKNLLEHSIPPCTDVPIM